MERDVNGLIPGNPPILIPVKYVDGTPKDPKIGELIVKEGQLWVHCGNGVWHMPEQKKLI